MILSEETKKNLSKSIGIPYEKLILMDEDEIQEYIEQKNGRKLEWPKDVKIDGLPTITIKETEQEIEKRIEEAKQIMERPSRSAIFRQSMRIKKEERGAQSKEEKKPKLPVHKRRISNQEQER